MPTQESPPYDQLFGLQLPQYNWVPAPRYLMRRSRILQHLQNRTDRGRLLEIGCGSGAMLEDYRRLGFQCSAVEISERALKMAKEVHKLHSDISFFSNFSDELKGSFDVIVSCEVIEHIEDDEAAMRLWASALKPGGLAIISTPGNPSAFSVNDVWAGHFRRYTQATISKICNSAGLTPICLESYGYPLVQITEKMRSFVYKKALRKQDKKPDESIDKQEATERSGIERDVESRLFPLMNSLPGRLLFRSLIKLQMLFLKREIGNGLLCLAIKK